MFKSKKILQQIEKEKQELLLIKEQIEKEKKELQFIKEKLEASTPMVDISDVYVWLYKGEYSIVRLNVEKIRGRLLNGNGPLVDAYCSTLFDIFTNNVIYQKKSIDKIQQKELVNINEPQIAYLSHIKHFDKNLLAYIDKKVPLYVLQQLYYRLNNVDVDAYVLKKKK